MKTWTDAFDRNGLIRYAKNSGWHLLTRLSTILIGFFTTIYVIRYLGPENYGTLSYAVGFVGLFSFVASMGIESIVLRELIKRPTEEAVILGTAFRLKIAGAIMAILLTLAVSLFIGATQIEMILIGLISLTQFAGAGQISVYSFQAKVESKYPALIAVSISFILSAAKLMVVFFDKGIIFFALVLVLETILSFLFYFIGYQKKYRLLGAWKYDRSMALSLLHNSWPLMLSTISILIYSRIDQVMLRHYLDVTAVGIYDAAVRLSDVWYIIPNVIIGALFPAIINAQTTSPQLFRKRIWLCAGLLTALNLIIIFPTNILSPYIIEILYGGKFIGTDSILVIYIWSLIGFSLGQLMNTYLIAENFVYIYFFTSVGTVIVNVVLNMLLIPNFGVNGAALATLVSYSLIPLIPFVFKRVRVQLLSLH